MIKDPGSIELTVSSWIQEASSLVPLFAPIDLSRGKFQSSSSEAQLKWNWRGQELGGGHWARLHRIRGPNLDSRISQFRANSASDWRIINCQEALIFLGDLNSQFSPQFNLETLEKSDRWNNTIHGVSLILQIIIPCTDLLSPHSQCFIPWINV